MGWAPAYGSTVDLNGKTYQTFSLSDGPSISAKLGESTTVSYATVFGTTFDYSYQNALAFNVDKFGYNYYTVDPSLDTNDPNNTAFSLSNANGAISDGLWYLYFDLTFAPTATNIVSDAAYPFAGPPDQTIAQAGLDLEMGWVGVTFITPADLSSFDSIDILNYQGSLLANYDYSTDYEFRTLVGNVLPAGPSVTPVPLPGSLAFLTLGMLGLGAVARRRS